MRQFMNIFKFELGSYLKNKPFIVTTLVLILITGVLLSFPRITSLVGHKGAEGGEETKTILVSGQSPSERQALADGLEAATGERVEVTDQSAEAMTELVNSGRYDSAVFIESPTKYKYIVKDMGLYDSTRSVIDEVMLEQYRINGLERLGMTKEASVKLMSATIESDLIQTGKDQMQNFFYTYLLIFALYIAILLYGQSVATSVAAEKSSRAMELLITSAKSTHLMFGKVLGAGAAGFLQLSALLGSSFLFFNLNQAYWGENAIVNSVFNMPLSIILYTVLFFVLGYALYSFLFGAVGSLVSKLEDINASVTPVTFLFIIAFFIVVFSMTSGKVDSPLMVVASYVPFTSPMAMFTRIAMGNVAPVEIAVSVAILIASVFIIGMISAKIYKMGVLLYGKPPKLLDIIKTFVKR